VLVVVLVCAAVGLGLGLWYGLRKSDSPPEEPQALYNPPSPSREGKYRFAAVAADHEECSQIGKYVALFLRKNRKERK